MKINLEELYDHIIKTDYNNELIDLSFSRTAYDEYNRQWIFGIILEEEDIDDRDYVVYEYGSTIHIAMFKFILKHYSEFLDKYKINRSKNKMKTKTFNVRLG